MKTNASIETLNKALAVVNKRYKNNIAFRYCTPVGRHSEFTLTVKSSKEPGARRSARGDGRRIAAACWHVHGHFFEAVLDIDPNARIVSCRSVITRQGGNWHDVNIGSLVQPCMYSQACECN